MYFDWKVGDRVCCVIDGWGIKGPKQPCPLVRNKVYTISDFGTSRRAGVDGDTAEHVVLYLKEVSNPYGGGFDARRFRKVQPRKTSIAIFEAMLHGNRSEVDA